MPGGEWSVLGGEDDEVIADVELLCDVSVGYHADVRVMRSLPTRVVRGGGFERSCGCYAHDNGFSAGLVKYRDQVGRSVGMQTGSNDKKHTYRLRTPTPQSPARADTGIKGDGPSPSQAVLLPLSSFLCLGFLLTSYLSLSHLTVSDLT